MKRKVGTVLGEDLLWKAKQAAAREKKTLSFHLPFHGRLRGMYPLSRPLRGGRACGPHIRLGAAGGPASGDDAGGGPERSDPASKRAAETSCQVTCSWDRRWIVGDEPLPRTPSFAERPGCVTLNSWPR